MKWRNLDWQLDPDLRPTTRGTARRTGTATINVGVKSAEKRTGSTTPLTCGGFARLGASSDVTVPISPTVPGAVATRAGRHTIAPLVTTTAVGARPVACNRANCPANKFGRVLYANLHAN